MLAGWIGGKGKQRLVGWWFSASRRYPRSGPRLPLQPVRPTWVCLTHACHTQRLFSQGRIRWVGRMVVTARGGRLIPHPPSFPPKAEKDTFILEINGNSSVVAEDPHPELSNIHCRPNRVA